jgi:hypothetical protein
MHPDPPKRDQELAEGVKMWQGKMRSLEAHREECRLVAVYKINAVWTLMTGKSKELVGGKQGSYRRGEVI